MKASVIIATYNGERFILEQLESIIHQTVLPSEIVISDDGSTDRTIEIIRNFYAEIKDLPIHCVLEINKGKHGVSSNFQNALIHANGDYVFFCDQDDIWLEDKIESILNVFSWSAKDDVKVVVHDAIVYRMTNDGSFVLTNKHLLKKKSDDEKPVFRLEGDRFAGTAFFGCFICGMCICAEREWLMSTYPFSAGTNHDNWILFCGFADNKMIALNKTLALYRIHGHNTCGIIGFRSKKSIWQKMKSFDEQSKKSVRSLYLWFNDTMHYLHNDQANIDFIDMVNRHYLDHIDYFREDRPRYLNINKIPGTAGLISGFKKGMYKRDGSILLFHDLFYLWVHTKKTRVSHFNSFCNELRETKLNSLDDNGQISL